MDEYHNPDTPSSSKHEAFDTPSPSASIPSAQGISAKKDNKMQPVFRVIEAYDKRNMQAWCKDKYAKAKVTEGTSVPQEESKKKGDLFAEETGPVWHKMSNAMITRPIIGENLTLQFKDLPIFGAPECLSKLDEYEDKRIREFVGFDLDDAEFDELKMYCDPDNLRTGKELKMSTSYPISGLTFKNTVKESDSDDERSGGEGPGPELRTLQLLRERQEMDTQNTFSKLLKYRGVKQFPLREQELSSLGMSQEPPDLEPGKDVLYRIRVFRPFTFNLTGEKNVRVRHSVFQCDVVMSGRQRLAALRDRFSCRNDLDMRLDTSHHPDRPPLASAKTVFPSGFLFINNVFYVDSRPGCRDTSAVVREWARARGLGDFPARDMRAHRLQDVLVRLAYPEVYVHQGSCEHLFVFSEVRLLNRADPLHLAAYPCHTLMSQNQSIYCTTCADFGAKWLVTGSNRVPFDPAFFCEICFKEYLYKDGQKIGDFKAYPYRGNQLNVKNHVANLST